MYAWTIPHVRGFSLIGFLKGRQLNGIFGLCLGTSNKSWALFAVKEAILEWYWFFLWTFMYDNVFKIMQHFSIKLFQFVVVEKTLLQQWGVDLSAFYPQWPENNIKIQWLADNGFIRFKYQNVTNLIKNFRIWEVFEFVRFWWNAFNFWNFH